MKRILLSLLLLCSLFTAAQEYYNDAQFRFNLGIEARLTKRFAVTFNQQDRLQKNASTLTRASFDVGLSYKINKFLRVKADYVMVQKLNKWGYFTPRNWYYVALFLKKDFGRWRFVDRNMFQTRMGVANSEIGSIMRYYYRNKLTVKYEITKRFEGYLAEEVYIPLNSPQASGIDRTRSIVGLSIITFKGQSVDLYFMYQAYLQDNRWFKQSKKYPDNLLRRDYIYGINYNISF